MTTTVVAVPAPPPVAGTLRVFETLDQLAEGAARLIASRLARPAERLAVALSGGSTPGPVYRRLAQPPLARSVDWGRIHWFWADERVVAHEDPDSNFRLARENLLGVAPVPPENIHAVPTQLPAEEAARAYEDDLKRFYGADSLDPARPLFDLILLGMGDDGHTASLLPGQPVLEERMRWTAAVAQGRPQARITLTYPALESARCVMFLVTGAGKHTTLSRARSGDPALPAARLVPQGECLWLIDRAAAKGT